MKLQEYIDLYRDNKAPVFEKPDDLDNVVPDASDRSTGTGPVKILRHITDICAGDRHVELELQSAIYVKCFQAIEIDDKGFLSETLIYFETYDEMFGGHFIAIIPKTLLVSNKYGQ